MKPRRVGRDPGASAEYFPMIAPVLLAVAVGVAASCGQSGPDRVAAVGDARVQPFSSAGVIAEPPHVLWRIGERTARGPHARVAAGWQLARDEVHHAAERRGAVQR